MRAHTAEFFDRVEVALIRGVDAKSRGRWIRQPSRELGIDGFDDLWLNPDDVPIAEYVPQERLQEMRTALIERAQGQGGPAAVRVPGAEMDRGPAVEEVDVDAADVGRLWRAPGASQG